MSLQLRVYVLDRQQQQLGIVDASTALNLVLAYNDVGSFSLTLPTASPQAGLFTPGTSVAVHQLDPLGYDMQPALFSGKVTSLGITESATDGTKQIAGLSDDAWLASKLIRPDLIASTTGYDTLTAPCETVIKTFAAHYLTSDEVLIAPDQARGGTVYSNSRYQTVASTATFLAEAAGIGWSVRSTVTNGVRARVLDCYRPTDRTSQVTFSLGQGSISSYTWQVTAATANRAVAAGTGDLTTRLLAVADNTQDQGDWDWVFETFVDETDESDPAALAADARNELLQDDSLGALQIQAVDLPAQQFMRDYFLGDIVSAYVDGNLVSDRVRQVTVDIQAGQAQSVQPVIGSFGSSSTSTDAIYQLLRLHAAKITHGQRRS